VWASLICGDDSILPASFFRKTLFIYLFFNFDEITIESNWLDSAELKLYSLVVTYLKAYNLYTKMMVADGKCGAPQLGWNSIVNNTQHITGERLSYHICAIDRKIIAGSSSTTLARIHIQPDGGAHHARCPHSVLDVRVIP
jgi:hypothetical protein